jgi:hypothetical protein
MTTRSVILATALAGALGGLAALATGCGPAEFSGTAYYNGPSMAYVGPGVQVVSDYDYPVFYADNFYWRYDDGAWYRSDVYNGGWVSVSSVPYAVRSVDRPYAYVHYHVRPGEGRVYAAPRGYSRPTYAPRGQRVERPAPAAPPARALPPPARPVPRATRIPADRDHRP